MLKAARASTDGQVIAVVQPHRYTRLSSLFEQFCTCFNDADAVIVAPVYAAGEQPIPGADRDGLVAGLKARGHRNVMALEQSEDLAGLVKGIARAGRLCRLPRRRQHHAMGLRSAGRARSSRARRPSDVPGHHLPTSGPRCRTCAARSRRTRPRRRSRGFAPAARRRCSSRRPTRTISHLSCRGSTRAFRSPSSGSARTCSCATAAFAGIVDSPRQSVFRNRDRAGRTGARRRGRAGREGRARGGRGGDRRAVVPAWHSRHDRRRVAHERRRLWRRDQGRARRGAGASPAPASRLPSPMQKWASPIAIRSVPEDVIFTEALFGGRPGDPAAILADMNAITDARSSTQPVNTRTGGSTFKNPPGQQGLAADRRRRLPRTAHRRRAGLRDALQFPDQPRLGHGGRIEGLGEEVRRRVRETSGVELEWEIKRVGLR